MSSPSTTAASTVVRAAAAVAGAVLLAGCGSGGSSGGGLYGGPPGGSSSPSGGTTATGGTVSSGARGGYGGTGGGRYSNPPAGSGQSSGSSGGAGVATAASALGTILVAPGEMTLYAFAADTRGHSSCSGSCATYWPPVPAADAPAHAVPGVTATFGAITRTDGTRQLTVDGYPVYTYAGDRRAGDVNGQGVNASGGLWWVLAPDGSWNRRTR